MAEWMDTKHFDNEIEENAGFHSDDNRRDELLRLDVDNWLREKNWSRKCHGKTNKSNWWNN